VLIAVFTFILGFAIASAVAGWLTKPLSEMTEKAHLLAQGDFSVDFRGNDYGLELVELADTLNFARDELSKTDKMQKELIANVSHDFKTPLTMIKAYASMIIEISGNNPVKRNKHAQVIVEEADRLSSLVSDVLDLSKIRSGLSEFKTQTIDMSAKLDEIIDRFAYLKETQGYHFEVIIEKDLYTYADEVKIEQALYNLIGNAVNYTGEDKTVFITLEKDSQATFRFSVRDTGKGIKEEELADIWNRYYRSNEAHKRPVQGTGLGLSIVKTVLQMHGFEFGVNSEVGKGSTFYVEFPCVEENA
jgi:signal transduction histidine kinase